MSVPWKAWAGDWRETGGEVRGMFPGFLPANSTKGVAVVLWPCKRLPSGHSFLPLCLSGSDALPKPLQPVALWHLLQYLPGLHHLFPARILADGPD